nr:hypothetical protein [Pseudomonas rhizoryzae]
MPSHGAGNSEYLYRGDTRKPEIVFNEGFQPWGTSEDLLAHTFDAQNPPSIFVSTSKNQEVAIDFGTSYRTKKGYLYTIRKIEGKDINRELEGLVPFPEEQEIAIKGGVKKHEILGATPLNKDGSPVGYSVLNPNRKP